MKKLTWTSIEDRPVTLGDHYGPRAAHADLHLIDIDTDGEEDTTDTITVMFSEAGSGDDLDPHTTTPFDTAEQRMMSAHDLPAGIEVDCVMLG